MRRTEDQLELEKQQAELVSKHILYLKEENNTLRRRVQRTKELLQVSQLKTRERMKKEKEKMFGKISDTESASHAFDNLSYASMSQMGGIGSVKVDIGRVEAINQNVTSVLNSKTPIEAAQAILKTFK